MSIESIAVPVIDVGALVGALVRPRNIGRTTLNASTSTTIAPLAYSSVGAFR